MNSENKKLNPLIWFILFTALICLLNLFFNLLNGKFGMSDFRVYYMAAGSLAKGEPIYGQAFGELSGIYKYSPFILFFFLPYTLFGFQVATLIHFIILGFAFAYTFLIIRNLLIGFFFNSRIKNEVVLLILAMVCIMLHLVKELYLGNVNILLLLLCLLSLNKYLKNRPFQGSILLGIVLLTKPFFIFLLIPLILRKNFKAIKWLLLTIIFGIVFPAFIFGPRQGFLLHLEWVKAMFMHFDGYPGVNSVDYMLKFYFFPGLPSWSGFVIILFALIMLAGYSFWNIRRENYLKINKEIKNKPFIFEWFIILALIPDLVRTDSEHFLCTAPLITFILYHIAANKKYLLIPVMVVLIFFYGGNSNDLLGHELSHQLFIMGLQGLSNLLLIVFALLLYLKDQKNPTGLSS